MNKFLQKNYLIVSILSTVILFLSFNFIIQKINFNLGVDFTSTKTFTLSSGTKRVIDEIEEPIKINFVYSRDLSKNIPIIQNYANQVQGLLNRYSDLASGKIELNFIEPEPYSDDEDYVNRYGVQGFPIDQEGSKVYFGLIASNTTDDIETVPFFDPSKAGTLEKQLTDIVYKLNRSKKPMIGFLSWVDTTPPMMPNNQLGQGEYTILEELSYFYDFEFLDTDVESFEGIDLLIVYHPSDISDKTEYAVEQFILNGGKSVIFVDPFFEKNDHSNKSSNLENVLKTLNINYNSNVILDGAQATRLQTQQNITENTSLQTMLKLNWPEVRGQFINQAEEIGDGLSLIRLVSPGGLSPLNDESEISYTPIMSSSEVTMDLPMKEVHDPIKLINNFQPTGISYDFGVKLNGIAKSNFNDFEFKNDNHLERSSKNINVVVFSDADFIRNAFWARIQKFLDTNVIEATSDNGSLVTNVFDSMTGYDEFIDLRNKEAPFRPFVVVQKLQAEAEQMYLGQEQQLQAQLDNTLNQIQNLSGGRDVESVNLSDKQLMELANFQLQVENTRKQLREVRRNLSKDIDRLANQINILNTFLIPVLLILLMFFIPRQLGIRKRKSR
ncbi:Gldg family protein [Alphaproteobacteria bacterium]|nr:Gldg family protein [Alphaproteobacteria bacterium]